VILPVALLEWYLLVLVQAGMPGWRPWKVECSVSSSASNVALVVVRLFGCVGGEERMAGDLGVIGVRQWRLPKRVLEAWFVDDVLPWYLSVVWL
jgi:hypothetical protein